MTQYNYASLSERLTGRNAVSRKLANNTKLVRIDPETIAVRLHETNVVKYHSDGRIVFDSGGYRTVTTKARMGEYSPAQVSQSKGVWSICMDGKPATYADGIVWNGKAWDGEGEDPKELAKLVKRIKTFVDAYMLAFEAGDIAAPNNGDCWGCLMVSKDGKGIMGNEHLVSHMEENYFVPSLLARAIDRFPVSQMAKAYISDKWAGTNNGGYFASIGREQLHKSLYRYMKEKLGMAA
jgi:hypothetical protein